MRNHFLRASGVPSSGGGGGSFITDDLTFHIDAGNTSSYSGSGSTVNSLVGSITNSGFDSDITYSSADGGSFVFSNNPSTGSGIEFPNGTYFDFGSGNSSLEFWFKHSGLGYKNFTGMSGYVNTFSAFINSYRTFHIGNQMPTPRDTSHNIPYSTWTHYVLSVDKESHATNTTVVLYLNGSTSYDDTYNGTITYSSQSTLGFATSQKFYVGGTSTYAAYPFNGNISIVRLYKGKALTSSEVATNYSAESSRYT